MIIQKQSKRLEEKDDTAQNQLNKWIYQEHDHDGLECQVCTLLVEVGWLPDKEPEEDR